MHVTCILAALSSLLSLSLKHFLSPKLCTTLENTLSLFLAGYMFDYLSGLAYTFSKSDSKLSFPWKHTGA